MTAAFKARNASEAEKKKIFEKYGVRWSELDRLPYWKRTVGSVVDIMHNLLLGTTFLHFLCLILFRLNVALRYYQRFLDFLLEEWLLLR